MAFSIVRVWSHPCSLLRAFIARSTWRTSFATRNGWSLLYSTFSSMVTKTFKAPRLGHSGVHRISVWFLNWHTYLGKQEALLLKTGIVQTWYPAAMPHVRPSEHKHTSPRREARGYSYILCGCVIPHKPPMHTKSFWESPLLCPRHSLPRTAVLPTDFEPTATKD